MEDIFDLTGFYYGDLFEKSSFFVIFIIFLLFFLFKKYFIKRKKEIIKVDKIEENLDFSEEFKKIKEKSLKEYLDLFSKFLEKKYKKIEISKMTFSEIKNIKSLENNEKKLFEKLYFLIYSGKNIDEKIKEEIFEELLNIIR